MGIVSENHCRWLGFAQAAVEVFEAREQSKVPVLLGSLANEGLFLFPHNENLSAEEFDDYLRTTFGDGAGRVKLAYAAELDSRQAKPNTK